MTTPSQIPVPIALRCPKCAGDMVTYERSGIHLDQCRECRGFFLDRGELEKLVDAEGGAWMGPTPGVPAQAIHAAPVPVPPAGYPGMPHGYPGMPQGYPGMPPGGSALPQPARYDDRDRGGRPKRRQGFLGELLEGFGD
jgi:Zn-finger nucleic acid-binding protein